MKNEERVSATRARLIEAAIAALADIGYHRTTFVEVSRRSNLSRGAIHHHFESIPDLMAAVARDIALRLRTDVLEALQTVPAGSDVFDVGIDFAWQQMQQPPYLAVLQIRAALATDRELGNAIGEEASDVTEWLQAQAHSMISASAKAPAFDASVIRVLLSSLSGAASHNAAVGAPPEDPHRAAFLSALKKMVKLLNAEKVTTAKTEEAEAVS